MLHRDAGKIEQRSQLLVLARSDKAKEDQEGVFMTPRGANFFNKNNESEIISNVSFESSFSTREESVGH